MADLESHYRKTIQKHYNLRLERNPRYSKSAFSKFLGISPAYYSKLMAGKLMLSLEIADNITKLLKLDSDERKKVILSVAEEQRCHALYLINERYTECDPELRDSNSLPKKRKRKIK